jgi:protein-tyrosine phosphatase
VKILFVCTGNICRSPMAEGILRNKLKRHNIPAEIDSAGLEEFHSGDPADKRALLTLQKRGIDISSHRARMVTVADFDWYDRIFIMDSYHYYSLSSISRNEIDMEKVDYLMNMVNPGMNEPVNDPWYDGIEAFEAVYKQLDKACDEVAEWMKESR